MQRAVRVAASGKALKDTAGTLRLFTCSPCVENLLRKQPGAIAVALSGGPDSMALLALLAQTCRGRTEIHALTVDHQLRPESAREAREVGARVRHWPGVTHHILKWSGKKPKTAIMESARNARYRILENWCRRNAVAQIWLGHNRTDQVETFLFRLAKGSGLDGLGGMGAWQDKGGIALVRPMLSIPKEDLLAFCVENGIPFVQDPTNANLKYARSRLRRSLPVLEEEGLSEKRLAATISRIDRARDALDHYTHALLRRAAEIGPAGAAIKMTSLLKAPQDIRIRSVRAVLHEMNGDGYGPRLERLEEQLDTFFAAGREARNFTIGGYLFSYDRKRGVFSIRPERG